MISLDSSSFVEYILTQNRSMFLKFNENAVWLYSVQSLFAFTANGSMLYSHCYDV